MSTTPARYQANPRKHDDKEWLREEYWGELRSADDIASDCTVTAWTIRARLEEFGIPRKIRYHTVPQSDPFDGFYHDDEGPGSDQPDVNWTNATEARGGCD